MNKQCQALARASTESVWRRPAGSVPTLGGPACGRKRDAWPGPKKKAILPKTRAKDKSSNLRLRRHHVLHEDGDVAELVARDAVVVAELDRDHIGVVAAVPVNL